MVVKLQIFFTFICVVGAVHECGPISKTFYGPSYDNYMLDYCRVWGEECGKPAADEFCKLKGFKSSVSFKKLDGIGSEGVQTKVISDCRVCVAGQNHEDCDAFAFITCTRQEVVPDMASQSEDHSEESSQ